MKDTEKIKQLYNTIIEDDDDWASVTGHISELLAIMSKIIVETFKRRSVPAGSTDHNKTGSVDEKIKRQLPEMYENLKSTLIDSEGEWFSTDYYELIETIKNVNSNIFLFCEMVDKIYQAPIFALEKISELIIDLLDLEFEEESQLMQEALKAITEKKSLYEFCGTIRSVLEKIIARAVKLIGEEDRKSIFNNLHTLNRERFIDKKLLRVIASNYSYGSQFIHKNGQFDKTEIKVFVDQCFLHIETIMQKIQTKKEN